MDKQWRALIVGIMMCFGSSQPVSAQERNWAQLLYQQTLAESAAEALYAIYDQEGYLPISFRDARKGCRVEYAQLVIVNNVLHLELGGEFFQRGITFFCRVVLYDDLPIGPVLEFIEVNHPNAEPGRIGDGGTSIQYPDFYIHEEEINEYLTGAKIRRTADLKKVSETLWKRTADAGD